MMDIENEIKILTNAYKDKLSAQVEKRVAEMKEDNNDHYFLLTS